MAVTIHVNGKSNSLAHKGANSIAKCTVPDVCKTPSPGGPVPIPYPVIIAMSSDLKKGTKTVKVDGNNMAAVKGSEYGRCTGDEPGTAGGIKSSTNMKEATWILYSFDVKLEGRNACRLSDKMQMNHGNTVCLGGVFHIPVPGEVPPEIQEIACKCHKRVEGQVRRGTKKQSRKPGQLGRGKKPGCRVKGIWKHTCCEEELKKKKYTNVKCEDKCGTTDCRLDVAIVNKSGKVTTIYDYKFNCRGVPKMAKEQRTKYDDNFPGIKPILIGSKGCK